MFNILQKNKNKNRIVFDKIKNDIKNIEEKRQYIQQLIIYIACDYKLYMSHFEIKNINKFAIVDLGAGYCIWSRELINKHFNTNKNGKLYTIYNVDINENILDEKEETFNFVIDLKKEQLPFKNIDFIYHRDMITVYNIKEWNWIINQIYNSIGSKKYVEFVEYDFIVKHISNNSNYSNIINRYLKTLFIKNNYEYNINSIYIKIKEVFENTKLYTIKLPLYEEDRFTGMCIENMFMGYAHFKDDVVNELEKYNLTFEKYITLLEDEWRINKSYINLNIITAQKI